MKILVTGGSGFVGSNLINSLSSDDHDIILVNKNKNKLNNVKMTDKIHILTVWVNATQMGDSSHYLEYDYPLASQR